MDRLKDILAGKTSPHDKAEASRREEDTDDERPDASREPDGPASKSDEAKEAKPAPKAVAKAPPKAEAKKAAKKVPPKKGEVSKKVARKPEDSRTALQRTSDSNFSKRAVLAGVMRIQGKKRLFNRCRHLVKGMVEEVMQPAKVLLQYYKKRTLTAHMVVHIASSKGHKLYWCQEAPKKPAKAAKA